MFCCDKAITIVRHIADTDSDSYTMTVVYNVGYTEETKIHQDGRATSTMNVLTITIPQDAATIIPVNDDHIVLGVLDNPPNSIADLKACGLPVYRVIAVNDYRGSVLGHWEVVGS